MPAARPIQTNFTAGELSPRLLGRSDISKYFNGARTMVNFRCHPHGGASKRPGTHFIAPSKDHTRKCRLVEFEFSDQQTYVLEFGHQYIRVYKDGGQVLDTTNLVTNGDFPTNITGWTDKSAGTGAISHDGANARLSLDAGGSGSTNQAWAEQAVTLSNAGDLVTVTFDTYADGVKFVVGSATGTVDIFDSGSLSTGSHSISFIASASPVYIGFVFDPASASSAGVDNVVLNEPYEISSPWTESQLFELQYAQSADVMWICHRSTKPQKLTRTGHTSWTLSNYAPTADPFTSAGNYPRAVTFFQQRLFFGGTDNAPSKFWGTKSGNYEDMTIGTADGDALSFVVASGSGKVPVINWLASADDLIIGTLGSVFRATGGNFQAITPTNIDVRERSSRGTDEQRPLVVDTAVLYVHRLQRTLYELAYQLQVDGYRAGDLTILSEHITKGGITQIAYQQEPDSIIWAVRSDGTLLGVTYERDQDVVGWHRHQLGGSGVVESVAVIPGASGSDEVWMVVRRTINGATVRYVELMDTEAWRELPLGTETEILTAMKSCHYVDSGLTYSGAATTTIRGLEHLIGETVSVLADGATLAPVAVNSLGQVTLSVAASNVRVGLSYQAELETLPVAVSLGDGTSRGRTVSWSQLTAQIHESMGGVINGIEVSYRKGGDLMDSPPPLFTGEINVLDLGYSSDGTVTITHNIPLPFTVLSITGRLQVNG